MAFSKDPNAYPAEFKQLFLSAKDKDITIDLGEKRFATNTCHKLHAFRRAVENVEPSTAVWMRDISIRKDGSTITLTNTGKMLSNALSAANISPDISEYEKELDKYINQTGDNSHESRTGQNPKQATSGELSGQAYDGFFPQEARERIKAKLAKEEDRQEPREDNSGPAKKG